MPPTLANGKICYIEMPSTDVARSAEFYRRVFGWNVRQRGDGHSAFDDTTGQVSGTWVVGRPPSPQPGLLIYVMVDSVAASLDAIVANGGEIVQPIGAVAPDTDLHTRSRRPRAGVRQPGTASGAPGCWSGVSPSRLERVRPARRLRRCEGRSGYRCA